MVSNFTHRDTVGPGTRTFSPRSVLLNAVTGLSYPTIQTACAPWYRLIQVSPLRPMTVSRHAVAHLRGTRSTIPCRPWNGLDTVSPI